MNWHFFSLKKKQMQLEAKNEIQRRNNMLLDKLFQIDLNPSQIRQRRPKTAQSLNRAVREKELDRIDHENRKILDKIQNAYSKYSIEHIIKTSATGSLYSP